jgi:glycosyltransferase involved in cell wall biosynthesis
LFTVGRITPSKNLEMLIEVLKQVREKQNVSLSIIGSLEMPGDQAYIESLRKKIAEYGLTDYVHFLGAIPNYELPGHIARARVFVQAAQNGSLDKALLEPLAMEVPLVTCAEGAHSLPLGDWQVGDVNSFSDRVVGILESDTATRSHELSLFVKNNHSLESLIPYIVRTLKETKSV